MGTAIISDGFARESATLGRPCGRRDLVRRSGAGGIPTARPRLTGVVRRRSCGTRIEVRGCPRRLQMMRSLRALARLSLLVAAGMLAVPVHSAPAEVKAPAK